MHGDAINSWKSVATSEIVRCFWSKYLTPAGLRKQHSAIARPRPLPSTCYNLLTVSHRALTVLKKSTLSIVYSTGRTVIMHHSPQKGKFHSSSFRENPKIFFKIFTLLKFYLLTNRSETFLLFKLVTLHIRSLKHRFNVQWPTRNIRTTSKL